MYSFSGLANFVPHTRGMYEIEVTREDDPLPGSPFHIPVGEEELCNASKVKIIGDTKEVTCNDWNILQFDLTSAGEYICTYNNHIYFY